MNLHSTVRGAITSINKDILAVFMQSTGNTVDAAGNQTPAYTTFPDVPIQVQAAANKDLEHIENFNQQSTYRAIYMFGNTLGVQRPNAKGGDLLQFSQFDGDAAQTWLVVSVPESWGQVGDGGWSKVIACLQL